MKNINEEVWKDIEGYEGLYQISSLGRVKSLDRIVWSKSNGGCYVHRKEKILKQHINRYGYSCIELNNYNGKLFTVHRLVAIAFIPNPFNKAEVNHINGIKNDNRVENLEMNTTSENQLHAIKIGLIKIKYGIERYNSLLTEQQVLEIRSKYIPRKYSQYLLGKEYSVSRQLISNIILRKCWKHI